MGIDIYASWEGMTTKEEKLQVTGFSTIHGHVGYLREDKVGPHATHVLVPESFEHNYAKEGQIKGPKISAKKLKERLPKALEIVRKREIKRFGGNPERIKQLENSYTKFVELCEKHEKKTGEPCQIAASY